MAWVVECASIEGSPRRPVIVGVALQKSSESEVNAQEVERKVFRTAMGMLRSLLQGRSIQSV
jgi:hypothetical protein